MIEVINYAKALSSIRDDKYMGSFIGKIDFKKINENNNGNKTYQANEIKCNKIISIIEINCFNNEKLLEKMIVTIVLSTKKETRICKKNQVDDLIEISRNYFITFTKKDIVNFSDIVGDNNPIHLQESAVVQGMLIIKELVKRYDIQQDFQIKFLNPVYEMYQIYLYKATEMSKKTIKGISNNIIYFKVYMEE